MHAAILLLLPYVFMVWLWTTLPSLGHADIQQRLFNIHKKNQRDAGWQYVYL